MALNKCPDKFHLKKKKERMIQADLHAGNTGERLLRCTEGCVIYLLLMLKSVFINIQLRLLLLGMKREDSQLSDVSKQGKSK